MPRKKKALIDREAAAAVIAAQNKPPPAWLKDCPLQDEDPLLDDWTQPSLAPGPALEACSGSDIYYQKASSKKTKYLAILPGLLALNHQQQAKAKATPKSRTNEEEDSKPPASASLTQDTNSDSVMLSQESGAAESLSGVTPAKAPTKKSSDANSLAMGQIRGLNSNTSTTLTLPVDEHRRLEFTGHNVSTSSKFIVLTLQPKKGRVVCKDVFSKAIIFGHPQEIVTRQESRASIVDEKKEEIEISSSIEEDDDKVKADSDSNEDQEKARPTLEHYGGSCRAWDGCMQGAVSNRTVPASARATKKPPPAVSSDRVLVSSQTVPATAHAKKKPPPAVDDLVLVESEAENEAAGNDSDDFHVDHSPVTKRTAPRRQSRKPVKYKELAGGDTSDDEESLDSSIEKPSKKKDNDDKILLNDSDDVSEAEIKKPPPKRVARKAATKASAAKANKGDLSSEDDGEGDLEEIIIPKSFHKSLRDEDSDEDFVMDVAASSTLTKRRTSRVRGNPASTSRNDRHDDIDSEEDSDASFVEPGGASKQRGSEQKRRKDTKSSGTPSGRRETTSRKRQASPTVDDQTPSSRKTQKVAARGAGKKIDSNSANSPPKSAAGRRTAASRKDEDSSYHTNSDNEEFETAAAQKSTPKSASKSTGAGTRGATPRMAVSSDVEIAVESEPEVASETRTDKKTAKSPPRRHRRRTIVSNTKSKIKPRTSINLSDGDSGINIVDAPSSASKMRKKDPDSAFDSDSSVEVTGNVKRLSTSKKRKKDADSDSGSSFNPLGNETPAPPKTGSSKASRFAGAKHDSTKKQGDGEDDDDMNSETANSEGQGLDRNSIQSMLAKAISKGKAARPSPAKPDVIVAKEAQARSPFGTPRGRRRRSPGKRPAKSIIQDFANDDEFAFLS